MRLFAPVICLLLGNVPPAFSQQYQTHVFKTVPFGGGGCVSGVITCPAKKNLIFALGDVSGAAYDDPTKCGVRFVPAQAVTTSVDYARFSPDKTLLRSGSIRKASGIDGPVMYSCDGGRTFNPRVFYVMDEKKVLVYTWDGTGFDMVEHATPAPVCAKIRVNPLVEGEFLAWGNNKLFLFSDKGDRSVPFGGFSVCAVAGWGKHAPGRANATIFAYGRYGKEAVNRIYRTDDTGATWVRVTDDTQLFGGAPSNDLLIGDMNVYGRVFFANSGIGLAYGDIAASSTNN